MTSFDPDDDRYWDGWTDAVTDMRRRLSYTGICADCALDASAFAGIAAAARGYATIKDETATMVELLVKTAGADTIEDQANVMGLARTLVRDMPDTAENAVVMLAMILARHYEEPAA